MKFKNASQRKAVMAKMKSATMKKAIRPKILKDDNKETPVAKWDGEIFVVRSKKWFDSVNGNTYHAVSVTRHSDNKEVFRDDFQYGYGNQWEQTAYDGLIKAGFVKKVDRFNHSLNNKRFIYNDGGYGLKRDLKRV